MSHRALLCLLLLGLGCEERPAPGSTPADMDRLAAAVASALIACHPRPAFEVLVEPDDPRDEERIRANYQAYFRLLLADEHVTVDGAAYSACVGFLESDARCDGFASDEEGDCDRIFSGTLRGGERCGGHEQCESGLCLSGGAAACGTCAESDVGQLGEFCGARACDEGLFCQYDRPNGAVCAALRDEDERCFEVIDGRRVFFRCREGLACAADERCHPEGKAGDPCGDERRCAVGLTCEAGTCAAPLLGEAVGDACDPMGRGCGEILETGLACEGEGEGARCVEAVVVPQGGSCDGGNEADDVGASRWCEHARTTHRCERAPGSEEGTCVERPGVGESCLEAACDVTSGGCVAQGEDAAQCLAWPAAGERCLLVDGRPTCGPGLSCVTDGQGSVCASSPFPASFPRCG